VRHLLQASNEAAEIRNEIRERASDSSGSGRNLQGAKTAKVVGKRNVMEKFDGPAIRKTGDKKRTVDHPMGLFALKNMDGSPLFAVADRRKKKKPRKK